MQTSRQHDFHPGFFIGLAIILLILPLRWCLALVIAAGFHELCHVLALRICGGYLRDIRFGVGGAVIYAAPLSPGRALLCSLAGPVGGLLLIALARWFPRLALCAAIQSAYNLLPLQGLDGGHALGYCLELFLPSGAAEKVCQAIEGILLTLLVLFCLYYTFILHLGLVPILAAGSLILKGTGGKIPCKSRPMRVQ